MTNLMISRNNWLEARRHDSATEAEASRHNAEMEALQREANAETARAHRESEAISRETLKESQRHSLASEQLTAASQAEQNRSNLAREAETIRHNQRVELNERAIARMTNSREWEKLSLQQQRNEAQNALDNAKTYAQKIDNWVSKHYAELGKYDLDVEKVREEIHKIRADIDRENAKMKFDQSVRSKQLTLEESRVQSQNYRDNISAVSEAMKALRSTIGIVTDVIGLSTSG